MDKKTRDTSGYEKRMFDANETCIYLGLGRNRGIEFAKAAGAERRFGRRRLYDKKVLDKALDDLSE